MKYEIVRPGYGPLLGHYASQGGAEAVCNVLNEKVRKKHKKASEGELQPFLHHVREVADEKNNTKTKARTRS